MTIIVFLFEQVVSTQGFTLHLVIYACDLRLFMLLALARKSLVSGINDLQDTILQR